MTETLSTKQAEQMGKEAHENGKTSVPALDQDFMGKLPSNGCLPLLEAWTKGWHTANLTETEEVVMTKQVIRLVSDRLTEDGKMVIRGLALETPAVWDDPASWNFLVIEATRQQMVNQHGVDPVDLEITEVVEAVYGMMGFTAVATEWVVTD